jgi:hypothetical protein
LGIILLSVGGVLGLHQGGKKNMRPESARPVTQAGSADSRNLRRALVAILVVVVVGVGTFYGTTLLASQQPGGNLTTRGSHSTSHTIGTGQTTRTSSISVKTFSPTLSTSSIIPTTTSHSTTTGLSTSSTTSAGANPFVLAGNPTVIVQGSSATLHAQYTNVGTSITQVNVEISLYSGDGTLIGSGTVFYPSGPNVPPQGGFNVEDNMGSFLSGSYTVTFFVVDNNRTQLSSSTSIPFNI